MSTKPNKAPTITYTAEQILALCTPTLRTEPYTQDNLNEELANSKMRVAMRLLPKMEADLKEQGIDDIKQLSKSFRQALMSHLGMTKDGATTYWYNLNQQRKGKPLYDTNSKWNKKKRDANKASAPETVEQPPIETLQVVNEPEVLTDLNSDLPIDTSLDTTLEEEQTTRWAVIDVDTSQLVVKNLTSRDAAQTHNRELKEQGQNTKVWDKTKDAA